MPGERCAIATVCLSGTLEDKLAAAATAGFDGIEVFEPDLVAAPMPPAEVRLRCADLGLRIELYQPFRDFDSTDPTRYAANLRRAERKFDLMAELGADTVLVCSSVAPDAVADLNRLAEQLRELAERAGARGLRVAYEALAWGRWVHTYRRSWDVVARAGHPALGLCLDSFHVLSRDDDPAPIAAIPAEKLFFLQLADAPRLAMDVLRWSRHHRLFPGQGSFDLVTFTESVLAAGYEGPLSLEVFNDVFRQADPVRTAVDARRSLLALTESVAARRPDLATGPGAPPAPELSGHAFAELSVGHAAQPRFAGLLAALGFARTGRHRSKPVELWEQGEARVLLNASADRPDRAEIGAVAVESADPPGSARRAELLCAPVLPRTRGPGEADLAAVAAPDGTSVFFCRTSAEAGWRADFPPTGASAGAGAGITGIDHIALTQPFDYFDEAALFYGAVLGLRAHPEAEFAAPFGLMRSRAVTDEARRVRLALSVALLRRGEWAPGVTDPQCVAFATDDLCATVRAVRELGAPLLAIPDNYYDDLDARFAPEPRRLAAMRELGVLYDRNGGGEYLQASTELLGGRVFFLLVQRVGGYGGYGWADAPVRMAAHRRRRITRSNTP
ncbi:bifunctional sugar phosphate isomerase/epimerase/4-hydroxyphenylpyruvate dioxygenase family protein [Pseudonocardia acaciae]|uniref:bifunctional sugar phosphate isomerase/epimerase/4-hydroxyphenylpyruvate dioxygenase family protein n=1 Tax=Pseudonocardia acaciae TaxID=551276 RepID=UPI00048C8E97|nr:sugar phosphate isomerase/epimerase and 4-hydroxyphenylpyruvate domain-containing protein [Pseudonocardia acaciae]